MTDKKTKALRLALETLENNKQKHHYCEDTWYSCPKHEDGCANEAEGDECNCGADETNAQFDKAITAIREALAEQPAQPAQQQSAESVEPEKEVTITCSCGDKFYIPLDELIKQLQEDKSQGFPKRFDTHPTPQPTKPLTDEIARFKAQHQFLEWNRQQDEPLVKIAYEYGVFAKAIDLYIEAAHGIKENT